MNSLIRNIMVTTETENNPDSVCLKQAVYAMIETESGKAIAGSNSVKNPAINGEASS